jgi:hypothetical protein
MMSRAFATTFVALFLIAGAAQGQERPYAGLQDRPVKALSDQQVADLRAGRGMGLALSAELNGYPGPSHVLELADSLHLSAPQRAKAAEMLAAMKAETIPIGERLIAQEQELEQMFRAKTVTAALLEGAVASIANTQAALRTAHLRYHLGMLAELSPEQATRYAELRGYRNGEPRQHRHGAH